VRSLVAGQLLPSGERFGPATGSTRWSAGSLRVQTGSARRRYRLLACHSPPLLRRSANPYMLIRFPGTPPLCCEPMSPTLNHLSSAVTGSVNQVARIFPYTRGCYGLPDRRLDKVFAPTKSTQVPSSMIQRNHWPHERSVCQKTNEGGHAPHRRTSEGRDSEVLMRDAASTK
jgi:hypothetical protein